MKTDLIALRGGISKPELFFGIVAAVGTPSGVVEQHLTAELESEGYVVERIHLSEFLKAFNLQNPHPGPADGEYDRVRQLIDRADELRQSTGRSEALSLMAAAHISSRRPAAGDRNLPGRAFILHQLKHPDEARWLRHIYGDAFHLIGVYSPRAARKRYLQEAGKMSEPDAADLIERDLGGALKSGQQLRSTFHLADVFVEMKEDSESTAYAWKQIKRFVDALFGRRIVTPTFDEFAMFMAYAASLRSADLSRQVGASIFDSQREIIAVGANEVPCYGGGQYWGDDGTPDHRDFQKGNDSNEVKKIEAIHEILAAYDADWSAVGVEEKETVLAALDSTRVANLTEFGRAVHAEMEAILSAARKGFSVRQASLYTTTFPCHNCAKHIVGAGISAVVYVEPYPKSLASDLHADSICFLEDSVNQDDSKDKVLFRPFVGIAPRHYSAVFSSVSPQGERHKRKEKGGDVTKKPLGLRLRAEALSHVDREAMAAVAAQELGSLTHE